MDSEEKPSGTALINSGFERQLELPLADKADPTVFRSLSPARPTVVYDTYWRFAAERQAVFFRKLEGGAPPWTDDSIIARHKFTNAYRASDRVSQYLIRNVIYDGDQSVPEVFFRTILFKLFNKIETWELLTSCLGRITWGGYSFDRVDSLLSRALASKTRIYSAAYIMPSGGTAFGYRQKHRNHLKLLERMMDDEVPYQVAGAGQHEASLRNSPVIPHDRGLPSLSVRYRSELQ